MITRAQLIEIAKELGLDWKDLSTEEIKEMVDDHIRSVVKKMPFYSADNMSLLLKENLYSHHNVVFEDKYGNKYDHLGNLLRKGRRKKWINGQS